MRWLFTLRRFFAPLKYTKTHEWVQYFPEQRVVQIGISDYFQKHLGKIIHTKFPTIGSEVQATQSVVVIETDKLSADVHTPVTGKVLRVNSQVQKNPALINKNAESAWLVQISCESEPNNLLSASDYKKTLKG